MCAPPFKPPGRWWQVVVARPSRLCAVKNWHYNHRVRVPSPGATRFKHAAKAAFSLAPSRKQQRCCWFFAGPRRAACTAQTRGPALCGRVRLRRCIQPPSQTAAFSFRRACLCVSRARSWLTTMTNGCASRCGRQANPTGGSPQCGARSTAMPVRFRWDGAASAC